ncbi:MAG: hypothetical protein LBQ76_07845 [Candidatus Fibromonas sp.]|jgi:hypothetical protein|nr:hypothetical protein [Candidatus Fibromonas sp.]
MAENELRRHKIRAELYDNVLTEDPNDFAARVVADKHSSNKRQLLKEPRTAVFDRILCVL